jgi:hypothetical protein
MRHGAGGSPPAGRSGKERRNQLSRINNFYFESESSLRKSHGINFIREGQEIGKDMAVQQSIRSLKLYFIISYNSCGTGKGVKSCLDTINS